MRYYPNHPSTDVFSTPWRHESIVVAPWGEEPLGAPDQHARVFAYAHFSAGHRYTVTGEAGNQSVECQCGKSYAAGSDTVVYP